MKILRFIIALALAAGSAAAAEPFWETRFAGDRTLLLRDGVEYDFRACLAEQLRRHPAMRAEDVLKQCFQGAFGPEHILTRAEAAKQRFDAEFAAVAPRPGEALHEVISPDFLRVNLGAWKASKMPAEWLFRMFAASARKFDDGDEVFRRCLTAAESLLDGEARQRFAALPKDAAPHHSAAYHAAEAPAYRLVSTRFLNVFPVLAALTPLPGPEKGGPRVIAIDGRAASGKTTLARQLALILAADVVHMDDFFLPPELRTRARYAEPGGNLHYERFMAEVLPRLRSPEPFSYRVFDCSVMRYGGSAEIRSPRWRIVEGAYSLHPKFGNYADRKIFYDVAPEEQMRRIRQRNGERGAQIFRERWIPLEELYIRVCDPIGRADLILGRPPRPGK